MPGKEQGIQRAIRRHLESHGWLTVKTTPGMGCPVGFPDQIAMRPDRPPVLIEVKAKGGRVSSPQRAMHDRLRRFGFDVILAFGIGDVRDLI